MIGDRIGAGRIAGCLWLRRFFLGRHAAIAAIAALGFLAAPAQLRAQESGGRNYTAFNVVTHLVVEPGGKGVRLFGRYDLQGPKKPIPYAEILAEAFRLPAESGPTSQLANIGFSLEPTAATAAFEAERRTGTRFSNPAVLAEATRKHLAKREVYEAYLNGAVPQAIGEIRPLLKRFLYYRMPRQEVDRQIDQIATAKDLTATLDALRADRILQPSDTQTLARLVDAGIERFRTGTGNILHLPDGTAERIYEAVPYAEPKFFGIDRDTQFARIVFEADMALKDLQGAAGQRLKQKLRFHQTLLEWRYAGAGWADTSDGSHSSPIAIFLTPRRIALQISSDARVVVFERADIDIQLAPRDTRHAAAPSFKAYSAFLTKHFDAYAAEIPAFWELRELAKIVAAVRLLKSRGIALRLPSDWSWSPPARIRGVFEAAFVGMGGSDEVIVGFFGGVELRIKDKTTAEPTPRGLAERFTAAAEKASAQADAVLQSGGTGVCYDGSAGCPRGSALGTVRIVGVARGSASLSDATLEKMRSIPAMKALLDQEAGAKETLAKAAATVRETETAIAKAQNPAEKGKLQVDLVKARDKEDKAKSTFNTLQVKVEQESKKVIVIHE